MNAKTNIEQMRQHLMDTLADLRDRNQPMEPDRARAVAQVAGVLVDTARVEIEYLKVTGGDKSAFLEHNKAAAEVPRLAQTTGTISNGILSITRHHLAG